jgi:hypothetical protein
MSYEGSPNSGDEKSAAEARESAAKARKAVDSAARAIHDGLNRVKASVENVKDAINEKMHRGAAEAERTHREVAGDDLTASEKLASVANEVRNDAQADIDALKQGVRKL